jgi:hemerythrin-like domain-containing protein
MAKQDVLSHLQDDHEKVSKLLDKLTSTTERGVKTRRELVDQIQKELRTHAQLEEEIVYPAFREAASTKANERLYYEAKEEHLAIEKVLADLLRSDPATAAFGGKAKVLQELVSHHVDEEQKEMFPEMRRLLSAAERNELGKRLAQRKVEIDNGRAWDSHQVAQ